MRILFVADIHIKLGQKNIPHEWSRNRYRLLWNTLNQIERDCTIFGGDVFDRIPSMEEVEVFFEMLRSIDGEKLIYPGNHESTSKYGTFLTHFKDSVLPFSAKIIDTYTEYSSFSILPYNELKKDFWHQNRGDILFTHVRGEIPPHVKPEIDLSLFSNWNLVIAGDLHAHSNSQANIVYPGSPVTTSFHRSISKNENGCLLIDTDLVEHQFIDLNMPQLIRATVDSSDKMISTEYHHTIYEIVGDLVDLKQVENTELLDKKITNKKTQSTLDLQGMTLEEELLEYLIEVLGVSDPESIMSEYYDSIKGAEVG
jgi:DNA repair exonuclease SbcCD nuclease subunit